MSGTGKITIPATAQLNISGGSIKDLRGRTIDNLGTTTWTGTGDIRSGNGAVFNNLADAVFDVRNDEPFRGDLGGAASVFNNVGTFRKSVTTGVTSINLFFNNTGTVDVDSGTLSFTTGGTSTGNFDVSTTSTILQFPSSTFRLNIGTTITGVGTTLINGGTLIIGGTATSTNAVTALNLDLVSGTLRGSGDLTMSANGQLDWTGGNISGTGKVTIPETAELNISGTANKDLRNRTIDNLGTTTWTGTGNIRSGNGAVFNNLAGGVFDVQNDEFFSDNLGGAAPRFNNAGTFKKTVGVLTTSVSLFFVNTGTVEVDSGLLSYNSGGTSTGNFDIATGATLQFPSSTFTLNAGTTITGVGTTRVNGGTVTIGATATSTNAVTALNLDVVSGTLNGSGDLTMAASGTLDWTGGTLDGGGKITIPATAELNISGTANKDLRNRTIDNLGTTTWTGTGNIRSGNGGVFNNLSGATFDAQNDRSFVYSLAGGATVFNNAGTFKKTVGTGTTDISLVFNNTGVVDVDSGILSYDSGGTSTGSFDVATGATLRFPSSTFTLNIGTTITGVGTTRIDGGTVTIGATATSTNAVTALNLDVVSGTLNGSGDLTMAAGGQLDWTGGTMNGGGKITIPETAELNISGTANKDLRNRTIDNLGTTTWTGTGNIRSGDGGVFNNLAGGVFDVQNDESFHANLGGAVPRFNNAGTFQKSAGLGTTTISVSFINTGTVLNTSGGILTFTNCTGCPP